MAIKVAFVIECQNLNSGSLRMNGRNSSEVDVGSEGPSSVNAYTIIKDMDIMEENIPVSSSKVGSIFGVKKAMKRLR